MKRTCITMVCATMLVLVLLAAACNGKGAGQPPDGGQAKPKIVCTTGMVRDAVENVVKGKAEVVAMMGSGVDPHLYKPTQNEVNLLSGADIVFYSGLHLEGKMDEVLKVLAKRKPVFAIAESLPGNRLIKTATTGTSGSLHDPHVWFDVSLWAQTVLYVGECMAKTDTANAGFYRKNAGDYHQRLLQLHNRVKGQMAALPQNVRILITSHDAFGYFGKAYGMEVRGLQGISTVSEFGLGDVKELTDLIVERKIPAIFVESSVPRKPLEAVMEGCGKKGWEVRIGGTLFSDAMGEEGSPEGTYEGMVLHNANTIVGALGPKAQTQ